MTSPPNKLDFQLHNKDSETTPRAFGNYAPSQWQIGLLRLAQHQPVNWLGRRLALILRRIVIGGRKSPVDAEVEGLRMRVHVNDNVSERKYLFMPQFCDQDERGYVRAHLSADGVFLDIGANAGIYTLGAARAFSNMGGKGFVLAVEANPTMEARLRFNIKINDLQTHVRIAPLALSDRTGEVEFTISDSNLGESGLSTTGSTKLKVPCKALTDLLRDEGISKVDGMKIDVEGVEDVILTPFFREADRSLFPGFIVIENSAYRWQSDLLSLLTRVGYRQHSTHRMNLILELNHTH